MLFISSICLPIFFPAIDMVQPAWWQWIIMIACGLLMHLTIIVVIKMMQVVRVSVTVGMTAGILMIGTSGIFDVRYYIGVGLIGVGMAMLLKMEFVDSM